MSHFDDEDDFCNSKKLANSADRLKDVDTHYETFQNKCHIDLDPVEYVANFNSIMLDEESKFKSNEFDIYPQIDKRGKIKKVFANSPRQQESPLRAQSQSR